MLRAGKAELKPSLQGFYSIFPLTGQESKDANLGKRDEQGPRQPSKKTLSSHRAASSQRAVAVRGPEVGKVNFSTTDSASFTYTNWPPGTKMIPGYSNTVLRYKFEVLEL